MTDAATSERSPREPFSGVSVRDLVRDVVAVTAMLVGLGLPWTATARGSDQLEIVLATVVAMVAVALPYARRAQLVTGVWAADERRTRWIGLAPLAVVAVVHLLLDVVPGGTGGVGAGLGLGVAGAVLAAGAAWPHAVASIAGVVALGAVAAPVLALAEGGLRAWAIVASVLTALFVLGVLWLTAGRYERGDQAAGVLLVGVGIVLGLGAALVGDATGALWIESVHGTQFGLMLVPVLAAAAVPRVVGRTVEAEAQPRLWAQVAVHAIELGMLVGAYVALMAVVRLISSDVVSSDDGRVVFSGGDVVESTLRLIFGVVVVVAFFFARRALVRDVASGHATAVGAAVVVAVLGLVLLVVRADGGTGVHPVDLLLAFGPPVVVLAVLLVPRSLRELRHHGPDPLVEGALAPSDDGTPAASAEGADTRVVQPYAADTRVVQPYVADTQVVQSYAADTSGAAVGGAAAGSEAAATTEVRAEARTSTPPLASAAETQILRPVTDPAAEREPTVAAKPTAPVQPVAPAQPAAAVQPAAAPAASAGPAEQAQPVSAVQAATPVQPASPEQPGVGPFGAVGATQVLPPVGDVPDSRWSAAQALDPATPLADLALIVQEAPHLRRYVAANPSTYPALLDWLGALGDPDVDAALRTRG